MDKIAPSRLVRISGKRKFTEPWMTTGLERSLRMKQRLYRETLKCDSTKEEKEKYL